jgi:energy-coupling factor transporter ATP-binding protein EcfA2
MSHIVEFSISGLAGREGIYAQTLDRHLNVFFGPNGSGKTSLLKILHSAMSQESRPLRNVPFRGAEVMVYSINYETVFTYTIDKERTEPVKEADSEMGDAEAFDKSVGLLDRSLVVSGRGESATVRFPRWSETPQIRDEGEGGWAHQYLPTWRLYLPGGGLERTIVEPTRGVLWEEQLDRIYAAALQRLWRDYYADILTAIRDAQEDGLASILKAVLTRKKEPKEELRQVDLEIAYHRVSRFLKRRGSEGILGSFEDFGKDYSENQQLRSVVSDINEIEKRIAEAVAPRDNLQGLIQQMFSGDKEVVFKDKSVDVVTRDDEAIGLSSLSSGEKHVLRILIETLLARDNSIIIDEPEISMHIDWQRDLVQSMQQLNPGAQIILATHSPDIMANVGDDKIFRL